MTMSENVLPDFDPGLQPIGYALVSELCGAGSAADAAPPGTAWGRPASLVFVYDSDFDWFAPAESAADEVPEHVVKWAS
jgi:hypothetical protein